MNLLNYTTLGRTGLKVSRLGIGASYGPGEAGLKKVFAEHGINYFVIGGRRNHGLRKFLKGLSPADRDRSVIGCQVFDPTGLSISWQLNRKLKQFDLEYADILLISWFNRKPSARILEKALRLKEAGKIRFIGISGHNRKVFGAMARQPGFPVDVYMVRYNAVHTGAERDIFLSLPEENRPGITTFTATCWGKLMDTKKMPSGEAPLTAADCYRFVLSNPNVDLCLTGPASDAQLQENIRALEMGPLSGEEAARIRKIGAHIYRPSRSSSPGIGVR